MVGRLAHPARAEDLTPVSGFRINGASARESILLAVPRTSEKSIYLFVGKDHGCEGRETILTTDARRSVNSERRVRKVTNKSMSR